MIRPETEERVMALQRAKKGIRAIARALGISRQKVRKIIRRAQAPPNHRKPPERKPSLLDPFRSRIEGYARDGLTVTLILQKLRKEGYTGGRTILEDLVKKIRGPHRRVRKPHARFETAPAEEAQQDWSTYTVAVAGKAQKIQLSSFILCWSRYQLFRAYPDQKLPSLLWGHVHAFRYMEGIPWKITYDNQAAITPFRIAGKPVLTEKFREFSEHYGFEVFVCNPGDPQRKGKVERPFDYFEKSFLPTRSFESLEDLNHQILDWLEGREDMTGNFREHQTTKEVPHSRWLEEKEYLYPLPPTDHLPRVVESRLVHIDSTISVGGNRYTVPVAHVGKRVWASLGDGDLQVYDEAGKLVARHPLSDGKCGLVIDEAHYDELRRKKKTLPLPALEREFLGKFSEAGKFLDALKREVRSVAPIHLREILALARRYRAKDVAAALEEALRDGTPTAGYVREILSRKHPTGHLAELSSEVPKGLSLGPIDAGGAERYGEIFGDTEDGKEKPQ
jgi:transposase